ncbi:MAG TPA: substrate-binding domain-containing protein [Acidimicrobiales bacterium]|nr:substrate-binding domain-containing protein [Acidimicrobiales bacterium]
MKFRRSRLAVAAATAVMAAGSLLALPGTAGAAGTLKSGQTIYFIPKDTLNPYEVIADKGGQMALKAIGDKEVISSGTVDTAAAQIPSIQAAIAAKASAIVIAGNDPTALCPSLAKAQAAGVKVVAFDSDVNCPNHVFINQANTQQIGTSEVDLLGAEIGYQGQIAILSAAATATNQNSWIKYMKKELGLPKYSKMKLVSTVYGNDDPATSLTVLQGLLSAYPNLRGIISPTTVGISTAAQYLDTHKSLLKHLTLTGLGLPSQMKKYVLDGTCKEFELWNPSNLGYLAGYAAASLASGVITGAPGQTFSAGKLGGYKILPPAAGTGPSVVLGPPTVFNKSNINLPSSNF